MAGSGYALVVLFAINLMNFFDRQIIGGVGEGIRREWALTDTALGLLGTVFTLLYAVVGLPLGRLSDRVQRRKILAAGVFAWSLLTALSGVAWSANRRASTCARSSRSARTGCTRRCTSCRCSPPCLRSCCLRRRGR
jgi:MFS family permease